MSLLYVIPCFHSVETLHKIMNICIVWSLNHHHRHYNQHPVTSTSILIITSRQKLTFKYRNSPFSHTIAAALIKYNLSLQSFTHCYITWISPSVHLLLPQTSICTCTLQGLQTRGEMGQLQLHSDSRGRSDSADLLITYCYSAASELPLPWVLRQRKGKGWQAKLTEHSNGWGQERTR